MAMTNDGPLASRVRHQAESEPFQSAQDLVRNGHEFYLVSLVQDASSIVIPPELHGLLAGLGIHLQIDFWPSAKK